MTRLEDDFNSKAEGAGKFIGNRSVTQLGCLVVAFVILISIAGCAASYIGSWGHAAGQIISPTNVRVQWTAGYQNIESLRATAANVCTAKSNLAAETDPFQKTQFRNQVFAYEATYRRIEADYDRAYENLWEGKIVKPSDLPRRAPSLTVMEGQVC